METFSALLAICAGNSPIAGEFSAQRPVTWSFDVSFDLHPKKRLSKQSWGWWFETPSRPLWRHCNASHSWQQSKRESSNLLDLCHRWFLHKEPNNAENVAMCIRHHGFAIPSPFNCRPAVIRFPMTIRHLMGCLWLPGNRLADPKIVTAKMLSLHAVKFYETSYILKNALNSSKSFSIYNKMGTILRAFDLAASEYRATDWPTL